VFAVNFACPAVWAQSRRPWRPHTRAE